MKNESVREIIEKAKQDHKLYGIEAPGPWPEPPKGWMVNKKGDVWVTKKEASIAAGQMRDSRSEKNKDARR